MPTEHEHAENLKSARRDAKESPKKLESGSKSNKTSEQKTNLWPLAFATAIACDALDLIPIIGWLISLFFRPFLYIFLWKQKSAKSQAWSYILLTLAFVPVIDVLPMDTAAVYKAYLQSKK